MVNRLLDTNCLIYILENKAAAQALLRDMTLYVPAPAVGELFYGAHNSARVQSNLERIDSLLSHFSFLPCDRETASIYGTIKADLRSKGKPIPDNDIWIAAIAMQYGLTLMTKDRHFGFVTGLNSVEW
jgi:tRNA(fMet)-specific endonuclease VapC